MPLSLWMPFTRCTLVLGAAAIIAATSACAQSSLSPNESSSNPTLTAPLDGFGGNAAIPAASSAASGSGGGAGQNAYAGNWKQFVTKHFAAEIGAGFNAPIGNDSPYITWGGNLTLGGGLHLNKHISLLAEYQFMDDKLPGALIADAGAQGGNAHIWSFTLDPVINLFPKRTNSIYVTGGGGFYRKLTSFTDVVCCDFYGYAESVTAGHFSSNQSGMNLGFGLTHRMGGVYSDGTTQLYAEARYLFLDTPSITETNGLGTTELIPVTFGIRW